MKQKSIKRKISRKILDKLSADNVKLVILFIPLLIVLNKQVKDGTFSIEEFLDTSIIVSFVIVFLSGVIAKFLSSLVSKSSEDVNKLNINYKELTKRYCLDNEKMVKTQNCDNEKYIPVICEKLAKANEYLKFDICYENAKKQYQLPEQIKDYSKELMEAHKHSVTYNNRNIRIDDFEEKEDKVVLKYSMTTYYDSLITNRAMDYILSSGKTVRDIFEPGPYISELKYSKMSNHLGFNGFVELKDGKIIFVMRSNNVSIGKRTLANSIGASMKTKYCLNSNRLLDLNGIGNAIRREIENELKIQIPKDQNIKFENTIFAFYRELIEGGKPQLLFYYKANDYDTEKFLDIFKDNVKTADKKEVTIDGTEFYFFSIDELNNATISSNILKINKKEYTMMPSATASIVMFLEWLKNK